MALATAPNPATHSSGAPDYYVRDVEKRTARLFALGYLDRLEMAGHATNDAGQVSHSFSLPSESERDVVHELTWIPTTRQSRCDCEEFVLMGLCPHATLLAYQAAGLGTNRVEQFELRVRYLEDRIAQLEAWLSDVAADVRTGVPA